MYKKINDRDLKKLQEIVGAANVLVADEDREPYSHDEVVGLAAFPEAVVKPTTAQQIARIFQLAGREKIPVTPRGAGTGLSGGAVPLSGGIVLSLEKMNRILEIDRHNLMAIVEPGVITGDLHRAVEAEGLFYPPDPASLDSCSIGGNVAENSGGPRAVKYGVTADYVCGLDAVLPSGEIISSGGKLVKNVTGYNLIQLLVGSEGTLAVVTRIVLRLIPLPAARIDLLIPFSDIGTAADTVAQIIRSRLVPTTIEFMERDSIEACEKLLDKKLPFSGAAAQLLIQLDGNDHDQVEANADRVGAICMKEGAVDVLVAQDRPTRDRLWSARRQLLDAVRNLSPVIHMEDVVVPRSEIPALLAGVRKISEKHHIRIISYGHAGDGNVHVNVLKENLDDEAWRTIVPLLDQEIYTLALSLGGMISGEHGIGATRKEHLAAALAPPLIDVMRKVRAAFDPGGILNPGKIFP